MNLVNIVISPPKMRVVISTTTRVELTMRLALGDRDGFICRLSANAIAPTLRNYLCSYLPLMLPLNHIIKSSFILILTSINLHIPKNTEGRKTPTALANMQENSTAIRKRTLNC